MTIRLVRCDDWQPGMQWNPPKRLLVDGVHRGWVQYRRTSGFSEPFSGGHYLISRLPDDFSRVGSKSTSERRFAITHSWDLQKTLAAVPGALADGLLPLEEEVPALLAKADKRIRASRRREWRRDVVRETRRQRHQARMRSASRHAEEERATIEQRRHEAREALISIRSRLAAQLTNFEVAGLETAIKRLT